ncbi:hypothetical protein [Planktothricoides raciborskii]|uniref:Uncharacterized protein n=1 Tax=Planktothricoides raciborskii GIHE-MW2 TaxID=2792601 RepID=A0AAU8JKL2_9CYAN
MDYQQINQAIFLLKTAAYHLENMVQSTPPDRAKNQTVAETMETVKQALSAMSAAINPPLMTDVPQELLSQAAALGIPLDDLEVRVAISSHHPSQLAGVLQEIDQRAGEIKRRRAYFLVRISEMPIEPLGPRVPVVTAADFQWPQEPISQEFIDRIKVKYGIDKLMEKQRQSPNSLFEKIKQAKAALEPSLFFASKDFDADIDEYFDEDEELPF